MGGRRGACRAWPGFEPTRRAKLAARTASGRAGPAAVGDQATGPEGTRNTGGAHQVPPDGRLPQPRRCEGRRRVRRARAGFEIDHSERSSRVAISRAAGPEGAQNTSGAHQAARTASGRAGPAAVGDQAGGRTRRRPEHQRASRPLLSADAGFWASRVVDEARHVALEEGGDGRGRARAVLGDDDVGFAGAVFLVVVVGAV